MKWFKRRGFIFIPLNPVGWLLFTGVVAYLVYAFVSIDKKSHSVSDTLISWTFNALAAIVIYSVIGYFTSKEKDQSPK